jgi:hypothetical protein
VPGAGWYKNIPEGRFKPLSCSGERETTPKEHRRQAEKQRNIAIFRGFLGVVRTRLQCNMQKSESHFWPSLWQL